MKKTFYLSHDYNTRADAKIKKLLAKYGYVGYGYFWAIVEDLYNNANALRTDYKLIAFDLRSDVDTIKSIICDFDLFVFKDGYFGSVSIQDRLDARSNKSAKARESALIRWKKEDVDANALQTHEQPDANALPNSVVYCSSSDNVVPSNVLNTSPSAFLDLEENKIDGLNIKTSPEQASSEIRKPQKEKRQSKVDVPVELPWSSHEFSATWQLWKTYKKVEKQTAYRSSLGERMALDGLFKKSGGIEKNAIEIIKDSMDNHYSGLFPQKQKTTVYTQKPNGLKGAYEPKEDDYAEASRKNREKMAQEKLNQSKNINEKDGNQGIN